MCKTFLYSNVQTDQTGIDKSSIVQGWDLTVCIYKNLLGDMGAVGLQTTHE